ncbi:MAG: hypothetical protein QOD47_2438, partial [Gemmatimonadaceae bacterium]|nr:hypothetical protein [Gemmatimonadaceae bacterium]
YLSQKIERDIVVLVMLDIANCRRRHRSRETCRDVFTTETSELSDSLELPSNPFCHFESIVVMPLLRYV